MKFSKNPLKCRRGAAIELAIFALGLAAIVGTLIISATLNGAKYIKADEDELYEFTSELELSEKTKEQIERRIAVILEAGGESYETETEFSLNGYMIKCRIYNGTAQITSWERTGNDD